LAPVTTALVTSSILLLKRTLDASGPDRQAAFAQRVLSDGMDNDQPRVGPGPPGFGRQVAPPAELIPDVLRVPIDGDVEECARSLSKFTKKELRDHAKSMGLRGISSMKKGALIELLIAHRPVE